MQYSTCMGVELTAASLDKSASCIRSSQALLSPCRLASRVAHVLDSQARSFLNLDTAGMQAQPPVLLACLA